MIVKLEIYSPRLSGICYVEGIGLSSNVYTIGVDEITVIDTGAGDPMNTLPPKLKTLDLDPRNVKQIILTHTHFDHTGGIEALASMASPRLLLHEDGIKNDVEGFGLGVSKLRDGDSVLAGDRRLDVIHTPGHMPGAICLYERQDKILFSGDTVFPDGGFGRTDLPGGESRKLVESLARLAMLEVDFILPGHMEPVTSNARTHLAAAYENAKTWL
jgi:glyoxylase-like metal-dependent hydrolase (beta-lactamase superfamily II)